MSLSAPEQRALAKIERALRSRDPLLDSLFATFTSLTWREAIPVREQIERRGWRPQPIALVPIAFVLIVAIIAVGSLSAASRRCAPSQAAASQAAADQPVAGAASRWDRGCPARMTSRPKTP
jgi:Protein of unknown function (DUF3040)